MRIKRSARLDNVKREFGNFSDRKNYYRLDRNEDPVGWEDRVFNELINNFSTFNLSTYSDSDELLKKLAEWNNLKPENLHINAGADGCIKNIFEVFLDPKDKILTQNPCWPMYWVYAQIYQAEIIKQTFEENLFFDIEIFLKTIVQKKPKIVVLANPNMPTGTMIHFNKIIELIKVCRDNNSLLIIDEAYHLFSPFTSINLINEYQNLIIVRTFSKAFGLAGLRIGYCASNSKIIEDLHLVRPIADANNLALQTASFALDNLDFIYKRIEDMKKGRNFIYSKLKENKIKTHESHGNFILIKCKSQNDSFLAISQIREKGYLLKGPYLDFPLKNYIRISIGPQYLMNKFWKECSHILKEKGSIT